MPPLAEHDPKFFFLFLIMSSIHVLYLTNDILDDKLFTPADMYNIYNINNDT